MPPFLTIVIPTLDEERYLERCVRSVLDDPYPHDRLQLLVVDGGSTDATVAIAERLGEEFPFLEVLHNPARLQSAAFNLALGHADPRATSVLRCDAHARYPSGFASRAVASLERTGAAMVGFVAIATAERPFQSAVAYAQSTRAGVGDSSYRLGNESGWVDSAMHGCFDRAAVTAVGGYDETASHNEDAELSLRLRRAGGGVWLDADLRVDYYPRDTLGGLARQYYRYGGGRAATCVAHGERPRARQLAPPALIGAELVLGAVAVASRRPAVLAPLAAYAAVLTAIGAGAAVRRREPALAAVPIALATMHHAWGAGFLGGIGRWLLGGRRRGRRR